jgi:hypothetical protein
MLSHVIKYPKFGYLDYKKKVYVIAKKDPQFPLCQGKCKYFTVPILLNNYTHSQNMLIAYTHSSDCTHLIDDSTTRVSLTCQDAKSLAKMLSIPLAVVINSNTNEIFFVPKRN